MAKARCTTVVVVTVFVTLRLYATVAVTPHSMRDTPSYFVFRWWGGERFPVMTGLYSLVSNHDAIVTIQAVISAACWSAAALLLGSLIPRYAARTAFEVGLLGLGLTMPVTRLDTALVSESIAVSLAVLLAALLIRLSCRPSRSAALATLAVGALTVFTRQGNAIEVGLIAVAVLLVPPALRRRQFRWKFSGALALIAAAGLVLASSNALYQRRTVAELLQVRIIGHPEERWFVSHGMPSDGRRILRGPLPSGVPRGDALLGDPTFVQWIDSDGAGTYSKFIATHPSYAISTASHVRTPVLAFLAGLADGDGVGSSRRVTPRIVEGIYWPRTTTQDLIAGLALLSLAAAASVRAAKTRRLPDGGAMSLALLGSSIISVEFVIQTTPHETRRHLLAIATYSRVAMLFLVASLLASRRTGLESPVEQ